MTKINVAILGCGMMGQEHISYIEKYQDLRIKFLCDPFTKSLEKALKIIKDNNQQNPTLFKNEDDLYENIDIIDLLVIASPNYMHTPQLLRWAMHPITILVEKPVAISQKQLNTLKAASPNFVANIWVAMEYRYIPAIQKLIQLLPSVGECKSITIRENRYPFLSKIGEWNKDIEKSGDTLVEKCCHFFDLFRLISDSEMKSCTCKVHRGVLWDDYRYDDHIDNNHVPIIDSAYVLMDFHHSMDGVCVQSVDQKQGKKSRIFYHPIMGCLELCMFAEGSRHQEEIIVTGSKGRLEAYLPENKVFLYKRPNEVEWSDRSEPPPKNAINEKIFNCSDLKEVYSFADEIPHHSGYHYCSTAIEWKYLINSIKESQLYGTAFTPQVSLQDGIAAVEMGISATRNITNERSEAMEQKIKSIITIKSCDGLRDLALDLEQEIDAELVPSTCENPAS